MNLEEYLQNHHQKSTVERYLRDIKAYLTEEPGAQAATYSDIINYISKLRERYSNKATVNRILHSIKKYYEYLVKTNQIQTNPAKNIHLRNYRNKDLQLQDLFTSAELENLLNETVWSRKTIATRNKVVISLLIYQALTRQELTLLQTGQIDLEKATIKIPESPKSNARELPLKPNQIMLFYKYLNEDRKKLLRKDESDMFLIDWHGKPVTEDVIRNLLEYCKKYFPGKNLNATTIRMSVITNLLKEGKDLRIVQAFAGHKYPSTTERYKQNHIEELKLQIEKYHPLNNQ
ncbi:MAG: tyrosine-type recombinase/integrase [Bacteroidales bacterium]|nr:tyrosine-type recombinase/integrase [Bacteroidales bacterium]